MKKNKLFLLTPITLTVFYVAMRYAMGSLDAQAYLTVEKYVEYLPIAFFGIGLATTLILVVKKNYRSAKYLATGLITSYLLNLLFGVLLLVGALQSLS